MDWNLLSLLLLIPRLTPGNNYSATNGFYDAGKDLFTLVLFVNTAEIGGQFWKVNINVNILPATLQSDRGAHVVELLQNVFKLHSGWTLMKRHQSLITCNETAPKHYCSVLRIVIMCVVVRFLYAPPHLPPTPRNNPHTGWSTKLTNRRDDSCLLSKLVIVAYLTVKSPVVVVPRLSGHRRKLMAKIVCAAFCVCVHVQVKCCIFGHS